jgi:surface antigen
MKKGVSGILLIIFIATLVGCANSNIEKQAAGAVIGGIGGRLIAYKIGRGRGKVIAIIAGTVLGALVGGSIGKQLDERDKMLMSRTTQNVLEHAPSGQPSKWRNPDSGNSGRIVPWPAYRNGNGHYCREFKQSVIIGGRIKMAYGTACRQLDGAWRIVG